jgi:cytochrome b
MKKILIWDLPTRLFHWAFAGSLVATFVFALGVDDDSPLFRLHMIFGLVAVFLLALRIAWGLFGSYYVRFASFPLNPTKAVQYFAGIVSGMAKLYVGHNPGSAAAALAMFALVPVIVFTGLGGGGEAFEDVHEVLAYALLAVIGAHLLGLVIHARRYDDGTATSMITGTKAVPAEAAIRSAHPAWGLAFFAVAAAWTVALISSYDANAATVRVPLVGATVQLGENEGGEDDEHEGGREDNDHDD